MLNYLLFTYVKLGVDAMAELGGKALHILRLLYEKGAVTSIYTVGLKQSELAKQLGITRQALNIHLRKLRSEGYIRTGRGFIDITEKGLQALGLSANPVFIFVKVVPQMRSEAYKKIAKLPTLRVFRVAGDMDVLMMLEQEKLNQTLQKLSEIEGIQDTKSYVTIENIK